MRRGFGAGGKLWFTVSVYACSRELRALVHLIASLGVGDSSRCNVPTCRLVWGPW